jgi:hypothetical protein
MEILALLTPANLAMDANTITRTLMTKMLAQKIIVIKQPESFITMQLAAMITTLAQLTLATLQKDANILLLILLQRTQQALTNAKSGSALLTEDSTKNLSTVMTMIAAQLINAILPLDNAVTLKSVVMTRALALMTLATTQLDVFTPTTFVMTIMLALLILAILQKDVSTLQSSVTIIMLALQTLA